MGTTLTIRGQVKEHANGCPRPGFDAGKLRLSIDTRRQYDLPMHFRYCHRGEGLPLGRPVEATGHIVEHPRYGSQIVIDEWHEIGEEAGWIYHLIADLPGIGNRTIDRLLKECNTSIVDILEHPQAQHLLQEKGTRAKQATTIVSWWHSISPWYRDLLKGLRCGTIPAPVRRRVEKYLQDHGLWGHYELMVTDLQGGTTKVPANPYTWCAYRIQRDKDIDEPLRVIDGFSLDMANACATAWGIPTTAPERIIATLVGFLEEASHNGHTCLPWSSQSWDSMLWGDLHTKFCKKLGLSIETDLSEVLNLAEEQGMLVLDSDHLYLPRLLEAEESVTQEIHSRLELPPLPQPPIPSYLIPEQAQAFTCAFSHGCSILTAPPGRGKSETVIAIAAAAEKQGIPALLVTPTGRAAARLRELADRHGIKLSIEPGTIHRLLLGHNEDIFDTNGLCIIEEASMVDIETMGAGLLELPPSWRLLIVGDADQLPSVGPGTVLNDLVRSGTLPVSRLEHNWRAESRYLAAAIDCIRTGKIPANNSGFTLRLVDPEVFSSANATDELVLKALNDLSTTYGVSQRDVLILTPRSTVRGNLETTAFTTATQSLGPRLRRYLNPPRSARTEEDSFVVGDKVLHRKNDYYLERFNGEQGIVTAVTRDGQVRVAFPDGITTYSADEARRLLLLNFVGTVHRNQGGEADVVLLLLRKSDGILLERRLVYTAVSRARRACLVLAEPGALERALASDRPNDRCGLLLQRLKETISSG